MKVITIHSLRQRRMKPGETRLLTVAEQDRILATEGAMLGLKRQPGESGLEFAGRIGEARRALVV